MVTVHVAHRCALVSAGLAAILGRISECRVSPVRHALKTGRRALAEVDGGILIADAVFAAVFLQARAIDTSTRMPKMVVVTDSQVEDDASRPALPHGVDECLPVECHEVELVASIRRLIGSPDGNRCRTFRAGLAPGALSKIKQAIESRMAEAAIFGNWLALRDFLRGISRVRSNRASAFRRTAIFSS